MCWSLFLIKLQAGRPVKKLQRSGFSVNIVKFLRTTIFKNICEQRLLFVFFFFLYNFAFNYVVINKVSGKNPPEKKAPREVQG